MGLQCVLMGEVYLGLTSIYSGPERRFIYLTIGHKKTLFRRVQLLLHRFKVLPLYQHHYHLKEQMLV